MNSNPTRNRIVTGLSLLGLGAVGMYFLDPKLGSGRRAMARDRLRHYRKEAIQQASALSKNVAYRTRGLLHIAGERMVPSFLQKRAMPPSDEKLQARVLSRVGRIPHQEPREFDIKAHDGCITVTGPINDGDYQRLYRALRKIPGVRRVERDLTVPDGQQVVS